MVEPTPPGALADGDVWLVPAVGLVSVVIRGVWPSPVPDVPLLPSPPVAEPHGARLRPLLSPLLTPLPVVPVLPLFMLAPGCDCEPGVVVPLMPPVDPGDMPAPPVEPAAPPPAPPAPPPAPPPPPPPCAKARLALAASRRDAKMVTGTV